MSFVNIAGNKKNIYASSKKEIRKKKQHYQTEV